MNIAYMALYREGTDLLGYVLLQNMQLARATLDVELEHMGLGALLAIAEGVEAALDLTVLYLAAKQQALGWNIIGQLIVCQQQRTRHSRKTRPDVSHSLKMADAMHLVGVSAHLVLGIERDDQLVFLAIVLDRNRFQIVAAHPRRSEAGMLAIRRLNGAGIGGKLPETVSILPQNAVGIIVVARHGIVVDWQLYRPAFTIREVEYPGITFALEREEDDSHSFRLLEVCQLFPFQHHSEGTELDGFGEFEFLMLAGSQDKGE